MFYSGLHYYLHMDLHKKKVSSLLTKRLFFQTKNVFVFC